MSSVCAVYYDNFLAIAEIFAKPQSFFAENARFYIDLRFLCLEISPLATLGRNDKVKTGTPSVEMTR